LCAVPAPTSVSTLSLHDALPISFGNSHHANLTGISERGEGQVIDVAVGRDAYAFERGLELLHVVGQGAVVQLARHCRVAELAVIHRNNLLNVGGNHGASGSSESSSRGNLSHQAEEEKSAEEKLHTGIVASLLDASCCWLIA